MRKLLLAIVLIVSSTVRAQTLPPLRIHNAGGTALQTRFDVNFVNSGCADNPVTRMTDCTIGSSGVMSISNGDGTLTLAPNPITSTGTAALALGHANTWTANQTFPVGSIPNATLANSSVSVNTSSPLGGGGPVSLGGTLTLTCASCITSVTASGVLSSSGGTTPAISIPSQAAHLILAGPTSGSAVPTFRALVAADIPDLSGTYLPLAGGTMTGNITLPANATTQTGSSATNTTALSLLGNVAAGASSIGVQLGTVSAVGSGELLSITNGGTEKVNVDTGGSITLHVATAGIGYAASGSLTRGLLFTTTETLAYGAGIKPFADNAYFNGLPGNRWEITESYFYDMALGAQLTAAATITPTGGLHHITGATPITTISAANIPGSSSNVELTLIADSATITFATGGNIGAAVTVAQNKAQKFVYDSAGTTWYPVQ